MDSQISPVLPPVPPLPDLDIEVGCVCPVKTCCKRFQSSSQLRMHILRRHDGCKLPVKTGGEELLFCPVDGCSRGPGFGQPFPRLGQLKQHYHTVHGRMEHKCERCGKTFGLKDVCNRHQAECGTVFECETCKDLFRTKNALYQHAKRKKHKLPTGSKPRKVNPKNADSALENSAVILVPIVVKQVLHLPKQTSPSPTTNQPLRMNSKEVAIQTAPDLIPDCSINMACQTHNLLLPTDVHCVDASTCTQLMLQDLQMPSDCDIDSIVRSSMLNNTVGTDASTNTAMDLSITDSETTIEQLIDASTNTIPAHWADPMSRSLVDAGTSTIPAHWADPMSRSLVDAGTSTIPCGLSLLGHHEAGTSTGSGINHDTVNLATQTNFDGFNTLVCDLSTQTDMELPPELVHHVDTDHFTSGTQTTHTADLRQQLGYEFTPSNTTEAALAHSVAGAHHHYPQNYGTVEMGTGPSRDTVDYGVQTSNNYYEITELLSGYEGNDFGTQTATEYTGIRFTGTNTSYEYSECQLADFSTQTYPEHNFTDFGLSDSCTQTHNTSHTLNDSGTQTTTDCALGAYDSMTDFGTQTTPEPMLDYHQLLCEFGTQT